MKRNLVLTALLSIGLLVCIGGWFLFSSAKPTAGGLFATPECAAGGASQSLKVPNSLILELNRKSLKGIVAAKGACYRLGISSVSTVSPPFNGLSFSQPWGGTALIEAILPVDGRSMTDELISLTGTTSFAEVKKYYAKALGLDLDRENYLLRIRVLTKGRVRHDRALTFDLNCARSIDLSEAESWTRKEGIWIDVRPESQFTRGHHPAAKNVPYIRSNPGETDIEKVLKAIKAEDRLDLNALPKDRHTPLIFSGSDLFDFDAIGALALAHAGGWDNLYWYREGEAGRLNLPLETPPYWTGLSVVSANYGIELLKMADVKFVDTRSRSLGRFPQDIKVGITGAVRVPFEGSDLPISLLQLHSRPIQQSGEKFEISQLPPDKGAPLVIYGEDRYDWAALKAAILAKDAGWSRVYWLRDGVAGWRSIQEEGNPAFSVSELPF